MRSSGQVLELPERVQTNSRVGLNLLAKFETYLTSLWVALAGSARSWCFLLWYSHRVNAEDCLN